MIQAITLLVIAALVAIDQVIKVAVVNRFAAGDSMDILFGLIRIRYVENTGAAFSSMQNQTVFLTIFTAVVIVMFIFLLMTKKIKPGFIYWCVAVIIAGGAGLLTALQGDLLSTISSPPLSILRFSILPIAVLPSAPLCL